LKICERNGHESLIYLPFNKQTQGKRVLLWRLLRNNEQKIRFWFHNNKS
jgi:hypothetical protein